MERVFQKYGGELRLFTHDEYTGDLDPSLKAEFVAETKATLEVEWPEMEEIEGFGLFKCPVSIAFGQNWGKWHDHEALQCGETCQRVGNPTGLREWK